MLLQQIYWDLLERYDDTDLYDKTIKALQHLIDTELGVPPLWYETHSDISLGDGQKVPAAVANNFTASKNQLACLIAYEIFESTFAETIDLGEILGAHLSSMNAPPEEYNFSLAVRGLPYEATHIYCQARFNQHMQTPFSYSRVMSHIDGMLTYNNIYPGPNGHLIDPLDASSLISVGWSRISEQIETEVIPELKRETKGRTGPPFR